MLLAIFKIIDLQFGNDQFLLDWLCRLLLATVCGFAIGFERKSRSKEAGVRTHAIVCLAAAIMMLVSKYGFDDLLQAGDAKFDGSRIAAQVVTGIGFLGAGMIFYRRDILRGLTTAAGIWTTAGIGLAIGAGMYVIGTASTAILIVLQVLLHQRRFHFLNRRNYLTLKLSVKLLEDGTLDRIKYVFSAIKLTKLKTSNTDNGLFAEIELVTDKAFTDNDIYNIIKAEEYIINVEKSDEV
ncbi:MAG: MgtC/SapB family protein [Clostridia bacterium]